MKHKLLRTIIINNYRHSFTLIESLVSLGILVVIFSVGVVVSPMFYGQQLLTSERDTLTAVLQRARSKALNNIRGTHHGVYLADDNAYILYEGADFASRNADFDEAFSKNGRITHGGADEVRFAALAGNASSGVVAMTYQGKTLNITIQENGRINW